MARWNKLFGSERKQPEPDAALMAAFPFDLKTCAGAEALSVLAEERRQGREEGFTALLLGDAEDVSAHLATLQAGEDDPAGVLERAASLNVDAWWAERFGEDPDYYEADLGDWPPEEAPNDAIIGHLDVLTRRPKKTIYLARIPTPHSWEVPAYLRLGGWNACPFAEEQVAVSRSWHERYGADIAAVTRDTVEYVVARPPADRDAAEKLAREQFLYCPDIVDQGVQSIRNLAALLLNAPVWYFWWD